MIYFLEVVHVGFPFDAISCSRCGYSSHQRQERERILKAVRRKEVLHRKIFRPSPVGNSEPLDKFKRDICGMMLEVGRFSPEDLLAYLRGKYANVTDKVPAQEAKTRDIIRHKWNGSQQMKLLTNAGSFSCRNLHL